MTYASPRSPWQFPSKPTNVMGRSQSSQFPLQTREGRCDLTNRRKANCIFCITSAFVLQHPWWQMCSSPLELDQLPLKTIANSCAAAYFRECFFLGKNVPMICLRKFVADSVNAVCAGNHVQRCATRACMAFKSSVSGCVACIDNKRFTTIYQLWSGFCAL